MPTGYLVTLGDNSLDTNDAISGTPTDFTEDSTIGPGSWTWTGVWTGNGGTYSNITDTGVYYLGTDGNVYFIPDTWTISSGSATVASAPAYISGPGVVDGTAGDDVIDAGYTDGDGDGVDDGDGSGPGGNGDTIDAGAGNDSISSGLEDDEVDAGAGADTVDGGAGDDTLDGGAGNDELTGGTGADEVMGGSGADTIDGGDAADTLHGGGGDDSITGSDGDDLIHGDSSGGAIGTGSDDIGSITITAGDIRAGSNTGDLADAQVGDSVIYDNVGTLANGDPVSVRLTVTEISNPGLTVSLNYNTANGPILIDGGGNPALAGETVSFQMEFINGTTGEPIVVSGSANITDIDDNTGAGAEFATLDANDFDGYAVDATTSLNVTTGAGGITGTGTQNNGATDEDAWFTGIFTDQSQLNFTLGAVENGAAYGFNGADLSAPVYTTVNGGGNDTLDGGEGADTVIGGSGNDSLTGGAGDDELVGGIGADVLDGGTGADLVSAGDGDDILQLSDGFGNDTITGGETGETQGDTLDLSGLSTDTTIDLTGADPEAGSVTSGGDTASFSEIENLTLGGGRDTIVLADGSGDDTVASFDMADSGDGTTQDQLDVSALTSDGGTTPVVAEDVVVGDDGNGNAVLTFPGGESLTLIGVAPGEVDSIGELVSIGIPSTLNFIVEGTDGAETIDGGYVGDPEGDMVDAGDNLAGNDDDSIEAYGGADTVLAGAGDDTVDAGSGNDSVAGGTGNDSLFGGDDNDLLTGGAGVDTLEGGEGSDTLYGGTEGDSLNGGAGNDSVFGDEGQDTMFGGAGSDTMDGGQDDDLQYGGAGDDTVYGNVGNDTLYGEAGNDFVRGSFGEDELHGGSGNDSIWGGYNDDTIVIEDNFGNDTIDGDASDETLGDTLDLTATTTGLTIDLTDVNPENGTFSDGTFTASFTDIENILLGGGNDTITLADFGGADIVQGFAAPTVNGDGSLTGVDMLDVSALTSDGGFTPVNARDVVVGDDGNGNAVLTFPGGESITLVGIDPVTADDHEFLVAIGIPSNLVVDGTAAGDAMGTDYVDSEGDQTDGTDGVDDTILGYAGDDTIAGGLGADTIDGGADNDLIDGGAGADEIAGGSGNDTIDGGADADLVQGGTGDDSLIGGAGNDTLEGWTGDDTLVADGGDDSLSGFDGDDTFELTDATGNSTVIGGEDDEALGDTLDLGGVTEDLTIDLTGLDSESGSVSDGTHTTGFSEIETIALGGGTDTLVLADGSGTDAVEGFESPTANGDGTYSGGDQLDVSALTSDGGTTPVHAGDVVVSDDGSGNAVLGFPGGETLTLVGVDPVTASDPAWLVAVGIPSDGILTGTGGDDTIIAGSWIDEDTDVVDGGDAHLPGEAPQDDIIQAGAGNDSVEAGAGDDEIDGSFGNDTLDGGAGNDAIIGGSGTDELIGGTGADTLEGQDGSDTLDGGSGADSLSGGDAGDALSGGADNDTLEGGAGADTLSGGSGNDDISGGDDRDLIELGADAGTDVIDGGSGGTDEDTLSLTDTLGASVTLTADEAGDVISGTGTASFTEIETLLLGSGDDTVDGSGDGSGMTIDGGAGDDSIEGGTGADSILGGDDADTIIGGRNDTVDGGSGGDDNDTLVIQGPAVITYDIPGGESGTVTWTNGDTLTFSEIENVDYIPCFTPGTQIKTARGEVAVERLRVGDRVLTRDNGYQMIRWIGARTLGAAELAARPALRPIEIRRGALGPEMPERDMKVSPQHRVLIGNAATQMWFGEEEVLVAATHLTCLDGAEEAGAEKGVTYVHILFDQHEVVLSDGIWSESFQPGDKTLAALDMDQRDELLTLFPELDGRAVLHEVYPAARSTLKAHQAHVLLMS